MASTIKVTNIDTPDGTGNITVARPLSGSGASLTNLPAANLTGTLPAISGASLTNLPAGGDSRNFIIDGDFTQWPEGTSATTSAEGSYSSALIKAGQGHDGATTCERSTDVPTIAESTHQSKYSLLVKCTGTDTSLTAGQYSSFRYHITGSDFSPLHKQQVTISFWTKTSAANSGHTYYLTLMNDAYNRSYTTAFVPTSSWTKITKTITLDTSGTWEFTEALTGLRIMFVLAIVSGYTDITADTWTAGFELAPTGMSNFLDDTGNEFYISQLQCVLGSSSPTFLGEPVATVARQVEYYVERYSLDSASN